MVSRFIMADENVNPTERDVWRKMLFKDAEGITKAVTDDLFPVVRRWVIWAFVIGLAVGILIGAGISS